MDAILVIDAGTTSMRSILFSPEGLVLNAMQKHNPPKYYQDGRVEHDPVSWTNSCLELLRESAAYAQEYHIRMSAISLTSFRSAVIPVDREGNPMSKAIMWQDTRTDDYCNTFADSKHEIFSRTGSIVSSVFSSLKMVWIKEHAPEIYHRAYKLAGIQDLLLHALTGRLVTDHSLAGRTSLMNITSRSWDKELLRIYGIDEEKLCDLVEPSTVAGALTNDAARRTGLEAGIPVITAGGDQQCAALGSGLLSEHAVAANTGTGSYVIGFTYQPVLDHQQRIFCTPSAVPDAYHLEASMLTTGTVYRWFCDMLNTGKSGNEAISFRELDREAESSPPGAHGLLVIPHFLGSGSPYWNSQASGTMHNMNLSTTRGDIARAILEGIVADICSNIDVLESISQPVHSLRTSGGMAKSHVFNQIQADMLGRSVIQPKNQETTALGAWISAALRTGLFSTMKKAYNTAVKDSPPAIFSPRPDEADTYRELSERRRTLYRSLYAKPH